MARNEPQFNIRMPQELKDSIVSAAKENGRSINSEIVFRLQKSFAYDDELKDIDDANYAMSQLDDDSEQEADDARVYEALQAAIAIIEKKKSNKYDHLAAHKKGHYKKR